MKQFIAIVALVLAVVAMIIGISYGIDYFLSDQFFDYDEPTFVG